MLISVHLPKTAGSSFFSALASRYGDRILQDYGDFPINTPVLRRNSRALRDGVRNLFRSFNGVDCVHGHFLPLKYRWCGGKLVFVTWLRDPVERLASHYQAWLRSYRPEAAPPLQTRMIQEGWSFERFSLGPELKDMYSQFFWGFPLRRFAFVGITEHYEAGLEFFSREILHAPLVFERRNANPARQRQSPYVQDAILRRKIEQHHGKDIVLYQAALNRWLKICPDTPTV